MNRSRLLVPLLALALATSVSPVAAQSDGESRTMGDIIADALEDLAREIGSAQDEISDLAEGIDPSDPEGEIDPSDPEGEIDPSDPEGEIDPSDPEGEIDPSDPDGPGEIDPSPDEPPDEGGYFELQLIPDPVPRAGRWTAINKVGTVACTGAAGGRNGAVVQKIPKTTETGRIGVRDEGRTLIGRRLAQGQTAPLILTWDPQTERFKGSVTAAAPGGRTKIRFDFRIVSANRLEGELIANVRVDAGGVKAKCTVGRAVTLKRSGGN